MATLGAPIPLTDETRREVRRLDWPLIAAALGLLGFGLMSMYSVSYAGGGPTKPYFIKQGMYIAIGLVPPGSSPSSHPKVWRRGSGWLYLLNVLLLLAVARGGQAHEGRRAVDPPSWRGAVPAERAGEAAHHPHPLRVLRPPRGRDRTPFDVLPGSAARGRADGADLHCNRTWGRRSSWASLGSRSPSSRGSR